MDVQAAFIDFAGDMVVKHIRFDNASEYKSAAKQLKWPHQGSTPGEKSTSGVAEGQVRLVKDGGRCGLIQSGLAYPWA